MLDFDKLLKQDLPSKSNCYDHEHEDFSYEPDGDDYWDPSSKECSSKECGSSDGFMNTFDNDEDPYNINCGPTGFEDTEDDDIEDELEDIDVEDIDDDVTEDDLAAIDDDDVEEEELSEDEAEEADKNMAIVATPILLDDELKEESYMEDFINEFPTMVYEGFLFESDLNRYVDTSLTDIFTEKKVFANKTRVTLNEKDRRKQLFEIGVQASARAANDPKYWKLQKCYKLERKLKAELRQKYRGEALRRVKAYVKRLKNSSSGVLKKLGDKITGGKK